jgi:flagellar basal-body rod protein FlgF
MDRLIYIAGSGAKAMFEKQARVANNLANASTAGFRRQVDAFRAVPVQGESLATRAFVANTTPGSDFTQGAVSATGRDLDVAIRGDGWIAVQATDGSEAYTRQGNLQVGASGVLQTGSGLPVVGDSGPISVPPGSRVFIAADGTVSALASGGDGGSAGTVVGRIKLVSPSGGDLDRRADGLFALRSGKPAEPDAGVALVSGALEGSNVSPVDTMVEMIAAARQFEMQMKSMQTAESDAAKASQLLALT